MSLSIRYSLCSGERYSRADHLGGGGSTGCSIVATGVSEGGGDYIIRISHVTSNWISSGYNLKKHWLLIICLCVSY